MVTSAQRVSLGIGAAGTLCYLGFNVLPDMVGVEKDYPCLFSSVNSTEYIFHDMSRLSRYAFHSLFLVGFPCVVYPLFPMFCIVLANREARCKHLVGDVFCCSCLAGGCGRAIGALVSTCMFAGVTLAFIVVGAVAEMLMYSLFFVLEISRRGSWRHAELARRLAIDLGPAEEDENLPVATEVPG